MDSETVKVLPICCEVIKTQVITTLFKAVVPNVGYTSHQGAILFLDHPNKSHLMVIRWERARGIGEKEEGIKKYRLSLLSG